MHIQLGEYDQVSTRQIEYSLISYCIGLLKINRNSNQFHDIFPKLTLFLRLFDHAFVLLHLIVIYERRYLYFPKII